MFISFPSFFYHKYLNFMLIMFKKFSFKNHSFFSFVKLDKTHFLDKFLFSLKINIFPSFFAGVFILAEVRRWRDFLKGLNHDPG